MRWQELAACAGVDPDVFFPHKTDVEGREIALAYCAHCPVTQECLDYALGLPWKLGMMGIFGGMTVKDRKRYAVRRYEREEAS